MPATTQQTSSINEPVCIDPVRTCVCEAFNGDLLIPPGEGYVFVLIGSMFSRTLCVILYLPISGAPSVFTGVELPVELSSNTETARSYSLCSR